MTQITNKGALSPIINTPTRTLNSAGFQPNINTACEVIYSVRIQCTLSLAGGQVGTVQLLSDSNSTPTTVICEAKNGNTGTLTIGLNTLQDQIYVLTHIVPAGDYVRLVTTNNTGTPTFTLTQQKEIDLIIS